MRKWKHLSTSVLAFPNKRENEANTFDLLKEIYHRGGEIDMNELWKLRINADLKDSDRIRNDTEFFLPQIWYELSFIRCSSLFLWKGSSNFFILLSKNGEREMLSFLIGASMTSIHFAHRLFWYLRSLVSNKPKFMSLNSKYTHPLSSFSHGA